MTGEVKDTYHDELVDYVKLVGEYIQEHAEALVQKVPFISDFNISISFDQECASIPEITVSTSMCPDPKKIQDIRDKHYN